MLGDRRDIASLHSDFYRQQYHKILRWVMYAVALMFVLIAAIIYFILFRAPQSYYANTTDGKILTMPSSTGKP